MRCLSSLRRRDLSLSRKSEIDCGSKQKLHKIWATSAVELNVARMSLWDPFWYSLRWQQSLTGHEKFSKLTRWSKVESLLNLAWIQSRWGVPWACPLIPWIIILYCFLVDPFKWLALGTINRNCWITWQRCLRWDIIIWIKLVRTWCVANHGISEGKQIRLKLFYRQLKRIHLRCKLGNIALRQLLSNKDPFSTDCYISIK